MSAAIRKLNRLNAVNRSRKEAGLEPLDPGMSVAELEVALSHAHKKTPFKRQPVPVAKTPHESMKPVRSQIYDIDVLFPDDAEPQAIKPVAPVVPNHAALNMSDLLAM